ncbi:MAG: hypothetical protein E6R13_00715 [Spirochaetes bacterium]|jgi:lipase chaperone LimK|nr:MAG: hypothetical protein E6R13_00715 [Spirochaetota bacterium]
MEEQNELYIFVDFNNPEHVKIYEDYFVTDEESKQAMNELSFIIFEFYTGTIVGQVRKNENQLISDSILNINEVEFERKD